VGESATTGIVPVPDRFTVWLPPGASSEMTRLPERVPVAVGVKVTYTRQLADGLRTPGQLLVWLKSPVAAKPENVTAPAPALVTVTTLVALLVPINWFA
jgi:hypothetical protein